MSSFGLFIPENNSQKGTLNIEGTVRIEGTFEGEIICEDLFTLGENAVFIGNISCLDAHIMGSFQGNIQTTHCIIYSSARFRGLLDANIAQIQKGSQIYGEVCITGNQS